MQTTSIPIYQTMGWHWCLRPTKHSEETHLALLNLKEKSLAVSPLKSPLSIIIGSRITLRGQTRVKYLIYPFAKLAQGQGPIQISKSLNSKIILKGLNMAQFSKGPHGPSTNGPIKYPYPKIILWWPNKSLIISNPNIAQHSEPNILKPICWIRGAYLSRTLSVLT